MQKIITHNGSFHADDVFAVATLQLHFGLDNIEVIRTRDEAIIATGDIVLDVGGVYSPEHQRFDHHQNGAPVRDNGIPYAAFGLIWKHYGEQVVGNAEAAAHIERRFVLPIDANDNGVSLFTVNENNTSPFLVQDIVALFKPAWDSVEDTDQGFLKACDFARNVLERAIIHAKAERDEAALAHTLYEAAVDKTVIVSDKQVASVFFVEFPEPMFIVSPDENGNWTAVAVRLRSDNFAVRKPFLESWAGLRDEELADVSGIKDAVFCHKAQFLFVANSKEGVLEAVKKTLEG